MKVYVITRWEWGGGGDDSTSIVAIYLDEERAQVCAAELNIERDKQYQSEAEVEAYEVQDAA